jgi:hypothetical protein
MTGPRPCHVIISNPLLIKELITVEDSRREKEKKKKRGALASGLRCVLV